MDPANSVKAKLEAFNRDKTTARGRECMEAYYRAGRIKEMAEFVESIFMPILRKKGILLKCGSMWHLH